jgi:hypothetical protein
MLVAMKSEDISYRLIEKKDMRSIPSQLGKHDTRVLAIR